MMLSTRWRFAGFYGCRGAYDSGEPLAVGPAAGDLAMLDDGEAAARLDFTGLGPLFAFVVDLRPRAARAAREAGALVADVVPATLALPAGATVHVLSGAARLTRHGALVVMLEVEHTGAQGRARSVLSFAGSKVATDPAATSTGRLAALH